MHILENHDSLKARSSKLKLLARGIADGMKTGSFRSIYKGQGIEFSGVREYLQGDDIRNIDWNALLTLAAEQNNSPTGAIFFDSKTRFSCAPKAGKDHSMLIFTKLDSLAENTPRGSSLQGALKAALKMLKKRALVFVFSDFRTTGYEADLARLAQKHDVVAFCCTDRTDIELPEVGCIPFVDVETNKSKLLPTSNTLFKRMWRKAFEDRQERFKSICGKRGVSPQTLSTADDPAAVLTRFFALRNRI